MHRTRFAGTIPYRLRTLRVRPDKYVWLFTRSWLLDIPKQCLSLRAKPGVVPTYADISELAREHRHPHAPSTRSIATKHTLPGWLRSPPKHVSDLRSTCFGGCRRPTMHAGVFVRRIGDIHWLSMCILADSPWPERMLEGPKTARKQLFPKKCWAITQSPNKRPNEAKRCSRNAPGQLQDWLACPGPSNPTEKSFRGMFWT